MGKRLEMERLRDLGKKALALPFAVALLVFCVLGLAVAPMMHMSPKEMPMAIVNLDEGANLPTGVHLVAGDLIEDNVQNLAGSSADDGVSPMAFTSFDSREELDAHIADYYGAIVIPSDFTEMQMAGNLALAQSLGEGVQGLMAQQQGAMSADAASAAALAADPAAAAAAQQQAQAVLAAEMQTIVQGAVAAQQSVGKPKIELIVNTAKSPVFANTMQSSMAAAMASRGVEVEVTSVGEAGEGANPLSGILGVQMMVMPLFIMSLVMSLLLFVITKAWFADGGRSGKVRAAGAQVGLAIAASFVAAVCAYGVVAWFGGIDIPARAILLLWLASFCLMLANVGLLGISIPLGAIVMICTFALGMTTAVLPSEMLPTFWADWVVPWAPQVAVGDGIRNIVYLDGGAFDTGAPRLLAWGCAGLAALAISLFIPSRSRDGGETV